MSNHAEQIDYRTPQEIIADSRNKLDSIVSLLQKSLEDRIAKREQEIKKLKNLLEEIKENE